MSDKVVMNQDALTAQAIEIPKGQLLMLLRRVYHLEATNVGCQRCITSFNGWSGYDGYSKLKPSELARKWLWHKQHVPVNFIVLSAQPTHKGNMMLFHVKLQRY